MGNENFPAQNFPGPMTHEEMQAKILLLEARIEELIDFHDFRGRDQEGFMRTVDRRYDEKQRIRKSNPD